MCKNIVILGGNVPAGVVLGISGNKEAVQYARHESPSLLNDVVASRKRLARCLAWGFFLCQSSSSSSVKGKSRVKANSKILRLTITVYFTLNLSSIEIVFLPDIRNSRPFLLQLALLECISARLVQQPA